MLFPRIGIRIAFGLALALSSGIARADPCSLVENPYAKCFRPRLKPTFRVVLVHYGENVGNYDFERAKRLFTERFTAQWKGILGLEILDSAVIPLKTIDRDLAETAKHVGGSDPARRTRDRLERLWYYYFSDAGKLIEEVNGLLRESGHRPALAEADAVLVVSEPQFEALGFVAGNYGFVEQPSEIAWALSDGGRTEWQTTERVVDELLHESGHLLGIDHASAKCFGDALPPDARTACCRKSPGRTDVMSYCRDRAAVKDAFYFGFTSCTKRYVRKTTVPALLKGGLRKFQPTACD